MSQRSLIVIRDLPACSIQVLPQAAMHSVGVLPRARFVLDEDALQWIYPPHLRQQIMQYVDVTGEPVTAMQVEADPTLLEGVELLFSGWRAPYFNETILQAASDLKAVFYGAGACDYFMGDAFRRRGIVVTSAIGENATPVAEFTVAQIVLCLKRVWQHARDLKMTRQWNQLPDGPSCYGSTVGLVSLGEIGRRVAMRLAAMDVNVVAYDIRHDAALAQSLGITYVGLEELFATSDVVSLHTPLMPQTVGMITGDLVRSMKHGASLINTSRGQIIDHSACNHVLAQRPDLTAVLDVTDPEPLPDDSILFDLPNVVLTPHIAGSRGQECERMGQTMLDELKRYLNGEPLKNQVIS
jgi:phosphoglycerate dehydrogenase-like enzyme